MEGLVLNDSLKPFTNGVEFQTCTVPLSSSATFYQDVLLTI
ncbi:hypothetical protein [Helicobacter felis]|nr:hypothetical protein [Helicobacter felis]